MKRLAAVTTTTLLALTIGAGPALAQEQEPPPEDVNCFPLLSSLVCYLPVTIGPFDFDVPVDINFPAPPGP